MTKLHIGRLITCLVLLFVVIPAALTVVRYPRHHPATADRDSEGSPHAASPRASDKPRPGDKERLAKIGAWRMAGPPVKSTRKTKREIEALVRNLSLPAIEALLADPAAFADVISGYIDGIQAIDAFPLRYQLRSALWQRYAELAPDAALARCFPDAVPTGNPDIPAEYVLTGVAKADPRHAFASWQSFYFTPADGSVRTAFYEPANHIVRVIMAEWTRQSHGDAAAAVEGLVEAGMRRSAYLGYASALGLDSNWAAEIERFQRLFPNPAEHTLEFHRPVCPLISSWAKADPAAAFAWMDATLGWTTRNNLEGGYARVIAIWVEEQPAEATRFLKNWIPAALEDTDRIYARILGNEGSEDPAISASVLELIRDPARLDAAANDLLEKTYLDPEILALLKNSKRLSPALRERVEAALEK